MAAPDKSPPTREASRSRLENIGRAGDHGQMKSNLWCALAALLTLPGCYATHIELPEGCVPDEVTIALREPGCVELELSGGPTTRCAFGEEDFEAIRVRGVNLLEEPMSLQLRSPDGLLDDLRYFEVESCECEGSGTLFPRSVAGERICQAAFRVEPETTLHFVVGAGRSRIVLRACSLAPDERASCRAEG